jgi:hypothetical protein
MVLCVLCLCKRVVWMRSYDRRSQTGVLKKKERRTWSRRTPVHKFIGVSGRTLERIEGTMVEEDCLRAATANTSAIMRGLRTNAKSIERLIISSECHTTHKTPHGWRQVQSEGRWERRRSSDRDRPA